MNTPTGEDGFPHPDYIISGPDVLIARIVAPEFVGAHCAVKGHTAPAVASYVEQDVDVAPGCDHFTIIPICEECAEFSEDWLAMVDVIAGWSERSEWSE